jgi:hypothetical protein
MHVVSHCPYCGEPITLSLDEGGGGAQRYVEDCSVCCRPIDVWIGFDDEGDVHARSKRLDE